MNTSHATPSLPQLATLPAILVIGCLIANASLAQSYTANFTDAEGFSNGNLANNADWSNFGDANGFVVQDAAGTGSVQVNSLASATGLSNSSTTYDATVTSGTFTLSSDFQFTDSGSDATGQNVFFLNQYSLNSNGTNTEGRTSLGMRKNVSNYQFLYFGTGAVSMSESQLGLDTANSDFQSDVLRMTSELTAGADASSWSGTYTLYNVTTDTILTTNSITLSPSGFTDFVADSSVFATIYSPANNYNGISDIEVLSFGSSYAIPEPSTYALLAGLIGLIPVMLRRR